jgi:hypothetical protein
MNHKTSEIYKILKIVRDESPFKREDIAYGREHRYSSNARKELLGIPMNLLLTLQDRGILIEGSSGYKLSEWSSSFLKEFEKERKKFGRGNVEIIHAMEGDKITYIIKVNPKAKLKLKTEIQPSKYLPELPEEYTQRKEHMINFLSRIKGKDYPIKSIEEKTEGLVIKTRIGYHRTNEERSLLNEIGSNLKMKIETKNEIIYDKAQDELLNYRNYIFTDENKQTEVVLTSIKRDKGGFQSLRPLEVKINLNQPTEPAEKLIKNLIENFSKVNV